MNIHLPKKGSAAYVFIVLLASLFVIGLIYVVMARPFDIIYTSLYSNITSDMQPTAQKIRSVWIMYPMIVIFGLIVWAIISTLKREPDTGMY